MRIAFVHFPGRIARLPAARGGDAPTEFLFGAVELERAGHEVEHYEVDPEAEISRPAARLLDANAGRGLLPPHLGGATLRGTHTLLPELRRADVVVATTTATAIALAAWKRLRLFRGPLVGIVAGLLNDPWRPSRRIITLALLRRMHVVLYGPGELGGLRALDARLTDRVHALPFGVDAEYWTPADVTPSGDVLAIGNDGHRDWETLLAAAPDIPARLRILTRHERPAELPENVTWEPADWHRRLLSDGEVRELYRRSAAVVVPVRDVPQPSGQSVTLQAMACARPVVLSRTRGLWAPETLHAGENVLFAHPGDPGELAAAVRRLIEDPDRGAAIGRAARATVTRDATVETYAERLLAVCRLAVERP